MSEDLILACTAALAKRSKSVRGDKYTADGLVIYVPQSMSRTDNPFAWIPDIDPAENIYIELRPKTATGSSIELHARQKGCYHTKKPVGAFKESVRLTLEKDAPAVIYATIRK